MNSISGGYQVLTSSTDGVVKKMFELNHLVFGLIQKTTPIICSKDYCEVSNVSYLCWWANIYLIFFSEYILSGDVIDCDNLKLCACHFYRKVFPMFKRKDSQTHYQSWTLDGDKQKAVNKLIWEELTKELPKLTLVFEGLGCGIVDGRDVTSTGSIYVLGWLLRLGGSNSGTTASSHKSSYKRYVWAKRR